MAPREFDCAMRKLALEYASQTLAGGPGALNLASVANALDLDSFKGSPLFKRDTETLHKASVVTALGRRTGATGKEIFVSVSGSDTTGDGSMQKPYATIHRAQTAARAIGPGAIVAIRGGTYYLRSTLRLTQEDSGTTYQAHNGENVTLSGGEPLASLDWKPWKPSRRRDKVNSDSCTMTITNNTACTRNPYRAFSGNGSVEVCLPA